MIQDGLEELNAIGFKAPGKDIIQTALSLEILRSLHTSLGEMKKATAYWN